jgi:hypothetical protein
MPSEATARMMVRRIMDISEFRRTRVPGPVTFGSERNGERMCHPADTVRRACLGRLRILREGQPAGVLHTPTVHKIGFTPAFGLIRRRSLPHVPRSTLMRPGATGVPRRAPANPRSANVQPGDGGWGEARTVLAC